MKKGFIEERIDFPGCEIEVEGKTVILKKSGKETKKTFKMIGVMFKKDGDAIIVSTKYPKKKTAAMLNTALSHLKNIRNGFEKEYEYKLVIVYSHFPMNVSVKDRYIEINNFAGEKKPRKAKIAGNTKVEVKGKEVFVRSHNKESAGQTAANIESATKVKDKDRRIFQDGIWIVSKPANK